MDIVASQYLKRKFYHFPDGWVSACLNFLQEEHSDSKGSLSNDHWCNLIEQQWLYADLREFEIATNITLGNASKFDGIACYQIMNFVDSSKPLFRQFQDLSGTFSENTLINEYEPTQNISTQSNFEGKNRTLSLELTDGIKVFHALEFKQWYHITEISVGAKVKLKGSFVIKRNVCLLKPENIEYLGGEIEELKIKSREEQILEMLKYNQNTCSMPISEVKPPIKQETYSIKEENVRSVAQNNLLPTTDQVTINEPVKQEILTPKQSYSILDRDALQTNHTTNNLESENPNSDANDEIFDQISLNFDEEDNQDEINREQMEQDMNEEGLDDDDDIWDGIDDEFTEANDQTNASIPMQDAQPQQKYKLDRCSAPFTYLSEIERDLINQTPQASYCIKGLIMRFISKLTISNSHGSLQWLLRVSLNDGASSLDCRVSNEFITRQLGFTAHQLQQAKQAPANASGLLMQYRTQVVQFQRYMIGCNCGIFTLKYWDNNQLNNDVISPSGDEAVEDDEADIIITEYRPINTADLQNIKLRLSS